MLLLHMDLHVCVYTVGDSVVVIIIVVVVFVIVSVILLTKQMRGHHGYIYI